MHNIRKKQALFHRIISDVRNKWLIVAGLLAWCAVAINTDTVAREDDVTQEVGIHIHMTRGGSLRVRLAVQQLLIFKHTVHPIFVVTTSGANYSKSI